MKLEMTNKMWECLKTKKFAISKRNRKTYKKLLMSRGYSRNEAEACCNLIASINGSYELYSRQIINADFYIPSSRKIYNVYNGRQ